MDRYLQNLIKVLGVGAAFAALPLFASLAALEPPWPPAIGYVSAALILLASLVVWEWTRKSKLGHRRRWIVAGLMLTLLGLLSYLVLYSTFVEAIPGGDERVVRGYECTRQAQLVHGDDCPDLSRDALQDAQWEALNLWTRSSVTTARVLLTLAWLVFITGLITCLGAIVAGRQFRAKGGPATRGP